MSKFFGAILVLLVVVIGGEIFYFHQIKQVSYIQTSSAIPSKPIKPVSSNPAPALTLTQSPLKNNQRDIIKGEGLFGGWENISGSRDRYILLNKPSTNKVYKVRVLVDKSPLSAAVGDPQDNEGTTRTRLRTKGNEKKFVYFYNLSDVDWQTAIPKGARVVFYTISSDQNKTKKTTSTIRRDKNNVPVVIDLVIQK